MYYENITLPKYPGWNHFRINLRSFPDNSLEEFVKFLNNSTDYVLVFYVEIIYVLFLKICEKSFVVYICKAFQQCIQSSNFVQDYWLKIINMRLSLSNSSQDWFTCWKKSISSTSHLMCINVLNKTVNKYYLPVICSIGNIHLTQYYSA